ncbi:MAG TPA: MFS transporter [Streptosporangiaceae bacterium]|nr:MFS transporter [Streptosporangiaceae bacterium]
MSRLARRFPVLGRRDFLLLLADRLIAPGAMAFSIVGVSFAVLNAGGTPADLSYVLAAQIAPCLVFCLVGGVIADRIPPQRVIAASNLLVALGEGTFGVLVLTGRPQLWQMILLEVVTGSGIALFYPASQALLPVLVPPGELQQASALSRLAMNGAMVSGAAVAGVVVAAVGPGWALTICGAGVTATVPLLLRIRAGTVRAPSAATSMLRELRDGWSEFRSHTWLWVIVAQYCVVMLAWFGGFEVLGPVVAKEHLGGPAAWGAVMAAQSVGLVAGGLLSLWRSPRRPMLAVAGIGVVLALTPLALAMLWPLPLVCLVAFVVGTATEYMMVVWTVTMARNIRPDALARVSGYDGLGSMMATPVGALIAGPAATHFGVGRTQYAAAGLIAAVSAVAMLPRDVRTRTGSRPITADDVTAAEAAEAEAGPSAVAAAGPAR